MIELVYLIHVCREPAGFQIGQQEEVSNPRPDRLKWRRIVVHMLYEEVCLDFLAVCAL